MSRTFALAEYQGNVANIKYMRSGSYGSNYGQQYDSEMPVLTAKLNLLLYDYKYNQQNSLLNHFDRSGSYRCVLLCQDQNVLKILLSIRLPMQRLLKHLMRVSEPFREIEKRCGICDTQIPWI